MLTSNKNLYTGIAVVLTVLVVSLVLFAQEDPRKNNSQNHTYDSSYRNYDVPEKYWLSEDQINKVDKIKTEYDKLLQPEIEKYYSVHDEYSTYQQQDEISNKRIREYQTELRVIEDNIYSLKIEAASKIRMILSNSQRPYYNNYVFNDWCDDWGWNNSSSMDYGMRAHGDMDCGCGYGSGMRSHDRMNNYGRCW